METSGSRKRKLDDFSQEEEMSAEENNIKRRKLEKEDGEKPKSTKFSSLINQGNITISLRSSIV